MVEPSHGTQRRARTCKCRKCAKRAREDRAKNAERERKRWQDPEYRDRQVKRMADRYAKQAATKPPRRKGRRTAKALTDAQVAHAAEVAADTARRLAAVERMRHGPLGRRAQSSTTATLNR